MLLCPICDDLVEIHVRRGSAGPFQQIDDKRVIKLSFNDFLTRAHDRITLLRSQHVVITIGQRGSPLALRKGVAELRIMRDAERGDAEIFNTPYSVDAIQFVARYGDFANVVALGS